MIKRQKPEFFTVKMIGISALAVGVISFAYPMNVSAQPLGAPQNNSSYNNPPPPMPTAMDATSTSLNTSKYTGVGNAALAPAPSTAAALQNTPPSLFPVTPGLPATTSGTGLANSNYPGAAVPGSPLPSTTTAGQYPGALPGSTSGGQYQGELPGSTTGGQNSAALPGSTTAGLMLPQNPSLQGNSNTGIEIPAPPPPNALSPEASQLYKQAEEAAARAQTVPGATPGLPTANDEAQVDAKIEQAIREQEHNQKSFERATHGLLPLSTDQIREYMRRLETTQKAVQPPSSGPPKPQVKLTTLSLDPGVDPPVINLVAGYVTTVTIVDASGEPWPIADVGVGGNFEVTPTSSGSHVVRIMPLTRFTTGNMSILLKELSTPIIFRLASGNGPVDMRYDARVPKMGPNAKLPLINRPHLEAGSEAIMLILDNAPPGGAKRMKVNGVDERTMAWSLDSHVYVRTPLTLLSPAWDASVSSADGMTVYEIGDAPVLLMSDNGAVVRARLMREDDHDKQP